MIKLARKKRILDALKLRIFSPAQERLFAGVALGGATAGAAASKLKRLHKKREMQQLLKHLALGGAAGAGASVLLGRKKRGRS